jgi:hypothetical protein
MDLAMDLENHLDVNLEDMVENVARNGNKEKKIKLMINQE